MGDLKVTADENRELTVAVMDESEVYGGFPQISKWVEIEPLLFRRVDKERYMAFQENEEGEIVNLTSDTMVLKIEYRIHIIQLETVIPEVFYPRTMTFISIHCMRKT
jgi:hypothetical protein